MIQTDTGLVTKTRHPKIFIGKINAYPSEEIKAALDRLRELSSNGEEAEIRSFLNEFLPEAQLTT